MVSHVVERRRQEFDERISGERNSRAGFVLIAESTRCGGSEGGEWGVGARATEMPT
jgi:hypothetical protein